ncbi:MAG: hypothetical protein KJ077_09025 [Anaerolineae bacterium]|nr:hypothetical protein [Anaerolineae bacterium]
MTEYNLAHIHTLLIEGFSAEELLQFCFDEPKFKPFYSQIPHDTSPAQLARLIVDYANRRSLLDILLVWVKEHNNAKYGEHQPYHDVSSNPLAVTGVHEIEDTSASLPSKQRIQIYLLGDFSSLSEARRSAAIESFATLMKISPEAIKVYDVYQGSVVFDMGVPTEAVQRLHSLLESNSGQLRSLNIEKVILKAESGEIEEWIFKDGRFQKSQPTLISSTRLQRLADNRTELRRLLPRHIRNLSELRQQAADYGPIGVPLHLRHEVEAEIEKIRAIELELQDLNTELQAHLSQRYAAAEQAVARENWIRAISLFQQILEIDRDYEEIPEKLAKAQKQQRLAELYDRGLENLLGETWPNAVAQFRQILRVDQDYKDARTKLAEAERQQQLAELYNQGMAWFENRGWEQSIQLFQQILDTDQGYKDVRAKLAEVQKHQYLAQLYDTVKQAEISKQWQQMIARCQQIIEIDPAYRDTGQLLWKARSYVFIWQPIKSIWTHYKILLIIALSLVILVVILVVIGWFFRSRVPPITPAPALILPISNEEVVIEVDGVEIDTTYDSCQEIDTNTSARIEVKLIDSEGKPLQPNIYSYNWRFNPGDSHNKDKLDSQNYAVNYSASTEHPTQTVTVEVLREGKTLSVNRICFIVKSQK